jgi:hypothetical protein
MREPRATARPVGHPQERQQKPLVMRAIGFTAKTSRRHSTGEAAKPLVMEL